MLRATADVVTFFELQGWAAGNALVMVLMGQKPGTLFGYPKS